MNFRKWLEEQGCTVDVYQYAKGDGYYCAMVTTPDDLTYDVTVQVNE